MKKILLVLTFLSLFSANVKAADESLSSLPSTAIYSLEFLQTSSNVRNPSGIEFTPSTDHATIDSYELSILRPDGTVLQVINIGKPTPDATNTCTAPLNVQPIAFAVGYSASLVAKAGTAISDPALSVNKFDRVPGGPSKVTIK